MNKFCGNVMAKKAYAANGILKNAQSINNVFLDKPLLETKYPAAIEPITKATAPKTPYNNPICEVD